MSAQTLIIIVAVAIAIIAALAASRSGPRVTQITRTVRKDKDDTDA
ncbi:MAG TPA: hypothetical protein VE820_12780 [Sphingomicrobium sp.]|nr:hypothetical protein [Sphingomicrobium sp.]